MQRNISWWKKTSISQKINVITWTSAAVGDKQWHNACVIWNSSQGRVKEVFSSHDVLNTPAPPMQSSRPSLPPWFVQLRRYAATAAANTAAYVDRAIHRKHHRLALVPIWSSSSFLFSGDSQSVKPSRSFFLVQIRLVDWPTIQNS